MPIAAMWRSATEPRKDLDPDEFRMTVGEHLEDLRRRLVLALVGFVLAAIVCLIFGRDAIIPFFCKPLTDVLYAHGLPTQLHSDEIPDVFTTFLRISLICAAALASPWMLYHFWKFVAAGLYPHERYYITKYIPLSIALLITGMLFVYLFVLPWTIEFFLTFSTSVPFKGESPPAHVIPPTTQPLPGSTFIQALDGRPPQVSEGQIWFDRHTGRLEAVFGGEVKVMRFSAENLIATEYKLNAYIDLVVGMLLTFGLSFQMPLVVLALVRVGIVERETLQKSRAYVYFGIAVLSAVITPGDTITATVLLTGPLVMLYELGLWLARERKTVAT